MLVILLGKFTLVREVQKANTLLARDVLSGKTTDIRELQLSKTLFPILVTLFGIVIDVRELQF